MTSAAGAIRILGIDPGSRITGFGVIEISGGQSRSVANGCVRIPDGTLADRLKIIFEEVTGVIDLHHPDEVAIEAVFMSRNADSALKLGRAQGAAICASVMRSLNVSEYTPAEVKQAIVGKGNAGKHQVQHMVKMLLGLSSIPQADAADALAVALCHAHTRQTLERMKRAQTNR